MNIRSSIVDAAAELIYEITHDADQHVTRYRLHTLLQTSGALRRQLVKRFESEDVTLLTDDIVEQAYSNEVARVVRNWPATGEWLRPTAFFGTAHMIRRWFFSRGLADRPPPPARGRFPTILDSKIPILIRKNESQLLYASPSMRQMFGNITPAVAVTTKFVPGVLIHMEDRPKFLGNRERMLATGERLCDVEYKSIVPGMEKVVVISSSKLLDDDGKFVGEMSLMGDAARIPLTIREHVSQLKSQLLVLPIAAISSVTLFAASLLTHFVAALTPFALLCNQCHVTIT